MNTGVPPFRGQKLDDIPRLEDATSPVSRTWDYIYEAVLQWGSFLGGPIRGWALSADTGYTVRGVRFAPRLGFRADAARGDGGPNRRGLGSFAPPFPAIPVYSGPSGILGPTNLIDATPSLRLQLSNELMFWRETRTTACTDRSSRPFVWERPNNLATWPRQRPARFPGKPWPMYSLRSSTPAF